MKYIMRNARRYNGKYYPEGVYEADALPKELQDLLPTVSESEVKKVENNDKTLDQTKTNPPKSS